MEPGVEPAAIDALAGLEASLTEGRRTVAAFLETATAYDILPESSKVVVIDTAVPVRLAFYALVEHGA